MRHFSFSHHVGTAWESLTMHRLRTLLTTIGIAVGITSITTVLALSDGVQHTIHKQLASLDSNVAIIRPAVPRTNAIVQQNEFTVSSLTEDDYEAVRALPAVANAAPMQITYGTPQSKKALPAAIIGTTPALAKVAGLEIGTGQFIDSITSRHTAVIGAQLALDLYSTDRALGETFTIRDQTFTVIGVLKQEDDPINFNAVDFNNSVIIHLATSEAITGNNQIQQIITLAEKETSLGDMQASLNKTLSDNHKGAYDFRIITGSDIALPTSQLFELIQIMLYVIALVSLVVGGVGIMNISLVSVAERTREIGLRKAIGATSGTIVGQFLIESLLICLFGALFGLMLGYGTAIIASGFLPFAPSFTWQTPLIALTVSLGTGILFGVYPALRAASKDPIESLRHYD